MLGLGFLEDSKRNSFQRSYQYYQSNQSLFFIWIIMPSKVYTNYNLLYKHNCKTTKITRLPLKMLIYVTLKHFIKQNITFLQDLFVNHIFGAYCPRPGTVRKTSTLHVVNWTFNCYAKNYFFFCVVVVSVFIKITITTKTAKRLIYYLFLAESVTFTVYF